jgi:glycine cleavage system H lipoate-binding protein
MDRTNIWKHFRNVGEYQYFTDTHEWIEFKGSIAYAGICPFKLTCMDSIDEVVFEGTDRLFWQNEVIASITAGNYKIHVHMPVNGWVKLINEDMLAGNYNLLLEQPLSNGWMAMIVPAMPNNMIGLLTQDQYHLKQRRRQWG